MLKTDKGSEKSNFNISIFCGNLQLALTAFNLKTKSIKKLIFYSLLQYFLKIKSNRHLIPNIFLRIMRQSQKMPL